MTTEPAAPVAPAVSAAPIQEDYAGQFTSDRPISVEAEDALGRVHFARRLAEVAARARADRGLVIGLVAPWGEGKSSVLELAKGVLSRDYATRARVVDFNPWLWSGTGQLVGQFFGEITRVAKTEPAGWATVAPLLERYGDLLSSASSIPGPQAPWVGLASKVAKFGGRVARTRAPDHADLETWRKAIVTAIQRQAASGLPRLVVFMDDLDRLLDNEIRDVAQLVKLTADFPQTVYVLAYDRLRVEKALTPSGDGRSYLEKIVQIPLTLPSPDPQSLRQVVEDALSVAIRPLRDAGLWEVGRWNRLYREALGGFLRTLRDAKRFANGLLVSVIQIGGEVNGVDLVGVTALRLFVPDVYDRMRIDRDLFVPLRGPRGMPREDRQRQLDEMLEPIDPRRRALAKAILIELFPAMDAALRGEKLDEAPRPPSIAEAESYWRYFALALTPGQLSDVELHALQQAAKDGSPEFDTKLAQYFNGPNGPYVARRMIAWVSAEDEFELPERLVLLGRLIAHWKEFPKRTRTSPIDQRRLLTGRVFQALAAVPLPQRGAAALELLRTAPWSAVVDLSDDLDEELELRVRARAQFHEAILERIHVLSDDELLDGPATDALSLLEKWGTDHEGRRRAERLLADDRLFVRLMRVAVREGSWEIPSPKLSRARAEALLTKPGLSEDDQQTLRMAVEAVATMTEFAVID